MLTAFDNYIIRDAKNSATVTKQKEDKTSSKIPVLKKYKISIYDK